MDFKKNIHLFWIFNFKKHLWMVKKPRQIFFDRDCILKSCLFTRTSRPKGWKTLTKMIIQSFPPFDILKGLQNPGKLIKLNSPVRLRQRVLFPRSERNTLNAKNSYVTFFRVGESIYLQSPRRLWKNYIKAQRFVNLFQ